MKLFPVLISELERKLGVIVVLTELGVNDALVFADEATVQVVTGLATEPIDDKCVEAAQELLDTLGVKALLVGACEVATELLTFAC
jgi:sulfur relay (sulfurtransferase) DsrF/TusC family protein